MEASLERRILTCPTLPSLPAVALEVLRLCRDEEIDLWKVADALSHDPALAARVLRAANSATLAARGKVSTIRRAVALLGSNTTLALALGFSLVRSRRLHDASGFDHAAFWRRSLFSAIAGRVLGEHSSLDREELFLAALLQDIGILALAEALRPEYGPIARDGQGDHARLVAREREVLGCDHAEVSGLLARTWHLPAIFEESALHSHAVPTEPPADARLGRLLDCVFLSGRLADVWVAPDPGDATRLALESARARLRMEREVLSSVLASMALVVPEVSADFEVDLGGEGRVQQVLDQAKQTLVELGRRTARGGLRSPDWEGDPKTEAASLAERSRRDPVTGLHGRAALDESLAATFARASEKGELLSVALCGVDGLEAVGHARGRAARDEVLADVARAMRPCVRQSDLLARMGEDLFAVVLPETPAAGARIVGERIRGRVEAASPGGVPSPAQAGVTLSIGIATLDSPACFASAEALLGAASQALSAARQAGSDRIAAWAPAAPTGL